MNAFIQMLLHFTNHNLIPNVSESLLDVIQKYNYEFQRKAAETPNPWDDIAASMLNSLVENVVKARK